MVRKTRSSNSVVTFPDVSTAVKSGVYSVTAGTAQVFVERFEDIHYARFAFSGRCGVTVSVQPSIGHRNLKFIHRYSIRPRSAGICARQELNCLTFTLDRPAKLVIQVNEYQRLLLFAEPLERNAPRPGARGVVSFADFAADNAGRALQTGNIKAAVKATPKRGTLFFPPGVYRTGAFALKSDMTLYLAAGAVIKGSDNPADYPVDKSCPYWTNRAFLSVAGARNVTVTGYGAIDGNGGIVRAKQHGPHLVLARDSANVLIENVTMRDAAAWCVTLVNCDNAALRNIKMINNRDVLNTDGFDICSSRRVVLEDSFNYCSDDAAVIKSFGKIRASDITVRRNVFLTKKSALKVGTEGSADITNVAFVDNDVVECDRGMTLAVEDGALYSNIRYINNRFESPYPDARQRLIDFYVWNRSGGGRIQNVLIKDCQADVRWPRSSTLIGYDEKNFISGVRFENYRYAGKVCHTLEEADVVVDVLPFWDIRRPHVHNVTISPGQADDQR
jgi:hypothetical protein